MGAVASDRTSKGAVSIRWVGIGLSPPDFSPKLRSDLEDDFGVAKMADKSELINSLSREYIETSRALSSLVDNYIEIHSNGEGCPACGGEVVEVEISPGDSDTVFQHDDPCPLEVAMKLVSKFGVWE